jgi:hypothetical protein
LHFTILLQLGELQQVQQADEFSGAGDESLYPAAIMVASEIIQPCARANVPCRGPPPVHSQFWTLCGQLFHFSTNDLLCSTREILLDSPDGFSDGIWLCFSTIFDAARAGRGIRRLSWNSPRLALCDFGLNF